MDASPIHEGAKSAVKLVRTFSSRTFEPSNELQAPHFLQRVKRSGRGRLGDKMEYESGLQKL